MKPKDRLKTVARSAKVAAMGTVALAFLSGYVLGQFKQWPLAVSLMIAAAFCAVYAVDKSAK